MHRVCRSYISFLKKISPDNMGNTPSLHNQNPVLKCISSSPRRRFGNGKAYGQVTRSHPQSYNRFPALNHLSSFRLRYHVGWEYDCPVFQVTSMPCQPQHHVRKLRRIHAVLQGLFPFCQKYASGSVEGARRLCQVTNMTMMLLLTPQTMLLTA